MGAASSSVDRRSVHNGEIRMSEDINHDRRRFLGTAAMTIAAAELG